jgi:hypothetical protein
MKIKEIALGLDNSYIILEQQDGRINRISVKRDKKRFNSSTLYQEYYYLKDGHRVYVSDIK